MVSKPLILTPPFRVTALHSPLITPSSGRPLRHQRVQYCSLPSPPPLNFGSLETPLCPPVPFSPELLWRLSVPFHPFLTTQDVNVSGLPLHAIFAFGVSSPKFSGSRRRYSARRFQLEGLSFAKPITPPPPPPYSVHRRNSVQTNSLKKFSAPTSPPLYSQHQISPQKRTLSPTCGPDSGSAGHLTLASGTNAGPGFTCVNLPL